MNVLLVGICDCSLRLKKECNDYYCWYNCQWWSFWMCIWNIRLCIERQICRAEEWAGDKISSSFFYMKNIFHQHIKVLGVGQELYHMENSRKSFLWKRWQSTWELANMPYPDFFPKHFIGISINNRNAYVRDMLS